MTFTVSITDTFEASKIDKSTMTLEVTQAELVNNVEVQIVWCSKILF